MKMPEQSPPVQRTGNGVGVSQTFASPSTAFREAFRSERSSVGPSQGPAACYGLQGVAQQMCLSMFT